MLVVILKPRVSSGDAAHLNAQRRSPDEDISPGISMPGWLHSYREEEMAASMMNSAPLAASASDDLRYLCATVPVVTVIELGATRLLVGDLVAQGYLWMHATAADSKTIDERCD
ncbi:hypothetical protein [Mycobacterium sp. ITM-2016-00318]|uniref:hypothetical protein n=1 Tax=Mycobacterium sp. ITM-2016-00318 TaxID=2099693 RepID=UPI0018ED8EAE|nr:hypothetical protein [Mycobacterium sp. ITM-2016-00318]WNG94491.1 hypothetical protein C6A82_008700 [Mycobacterium sp. ITM-2016-00318]